MTTRHLLALGISGATLLTLSMPAHAEGKTDQARKAIAAAQAKIDAGNIVGAAGDAPRLHAQAVTTLHIAQDELSHHAKDDAIRDATRASELADMALAASSHERNNEQRASIEAAQSQAAQANVRASEAQTAAAAAQADAAAARAAPPVIIQTSAPTPPTTTTVTTTDTEASEVHTAVSAGKKTVRHTVRHRAPVRHMRTTRTTVTTRP